MYRRSKLHTIILASELNDECNDFTLMYVFFLYVITYWSSKNALIFTFEGGFLVGHWI